MPDSPNGNVKLDPRILVTCIVILIGFGTAWGVVITKLVFIEKSQEEMKTDIKELKGKYETKEHADDQHIRLWDQVNTMKQKMDRATWPR